MVCTRTLKGSSICVVEALAAQLLARPLDDEEMTCTDL